MAKQASKKAASIPVTDVSLADAIKTVSGTVLPPETESANDAKQAEQPSAEQPSAEQANVVQLELVKQTAEKICERHGISEQMTSLKARADVLRDEVNAAIKAFYKAKVVFNDARVCPLSKKFMETMKGRGLAHGTAKNYLSHFRHSVAANKPMTGWNGAEERQVVDSSGQAEVKVEKSDIELEAGYMEKLKPVFNIADGHFFKDLLVSCIEKADRKEQPSVYAAFVQKFKDHGWEIENNAGVVKIKAAKK